MILDPAKIRTLQRALGLAADGVLGPETLDTATAFILARSPLPTVLPDPAWPWSAERDGADLVVRNARATCFGGCDDPQDSGLTASGISTKRNPNLAAVALPMDGRMFTGLTRAEHAALDGSPIPRIPFKTIVEVACGGKTFLWPVIDLGPGRRTGNAIDLTLAAARLINPRASARNFEARVDYRIRGIDALVKGAA